jgi:hypothetical protein
MGIKHWVQIDVAYFARRNAVLEAQEDFAIRAALENATGDERAFVERLLRTREENRRRRQRLTSYRS